MQFVNEPGTEVFSPMPIVVCEAGKTVNCVCLTSDIVGVNTHWYGNKTIACCGTSNCPACEANFAPVFKCYFVGQSNGTGNKAIVLVTRGAYEDLRVHRSKADGLFGLRIIVSREGRRGNSPMRLSIAGRDTDAIEYPLEQLERMVRRIFAANAGTLLGMEVK